MAVLVDRLQTACFYLSFLTTARSPTVMARLLFLRHTQLGRRPAAGLTCSAN